MNLPHSDFHFTVLTPAMVGGAVVQPIALHGRQNPSAARQPDTTSGSEPEMRAASIRGQVRWWHRFAHLSPACDQVWGRTEPTPVIASRVRLEILPRGELQTQPAQLLPHAGRDGTNHRNPWAKVESYRRGITPGEIFILRLTRLVGCSQAAWDAAEKAVKVWLLLGCLGVRANRAAGSVWPTDAWAPQDEAGLKTLLTDLGYSKPVSIAAAALGATPQELRKAASDTVENEAFLGTARPGKRKPSPTKMKVVRFGTTHRLILTAPDSATLSGAHIALCAKPLGGATWTPILP